MYAIYTYINGRKTFLGKHIKDEIVREFPFTKAVLWQNKNLGFDIRLLAYAKEHKIKIVKKKSMQIVDNKIEPPSLDEIQKALNKLKKIKI